MMIVMKEGATTEQVEAVVERVESVGAAAHVSTGEVLTVVGAIGDRERIANLDLAGAPGVDRVVPIRKPHKLESRQLKHGESSIEGVDGRQVSGSRFAMSTGPLPAECGAEM